MQTQTPIHARRGKFVAALTLALTAVGAVGADYQSTILQDTPLAYYPLNLDVDTGTTASDLSGNNNPGTYVNIYSGYNNVAGPSAYITNGVSLDGFTTYVDLSTGANPGLLNFSGPITLEAWVQPANPSQTLGDILAKGYDAANNYDEIALRLNGGKYEGVTYNGTTGTQGAGGGVPTTDWAHVVASYDGSNWKLYVNARPVAQAGDSVGAINFPAPWRIGSGSADGYARLFAGNLSQVALYNYGLSSSQVQNHYFIGKYGVAPSNALPIITSQPQPQSSYLGGSATFSVGVLSVLPTTNQWYKNGSPLAGQTNQSLAINNVQSGDAASYSVSIGNSNGVTNSTTASLSLLASGVTLQWSANGNNGVWDTGVSPNWLNLANSQQTVFNTTDAVLFDDTAGVPTTVSVNDTVQPSVITVNANANSFSFSGTGQISGPASLVKKGSSTLTLNVAGGFTGPVTIAGGTVLTAGNNTLASASAITVTNGGTLDFDGNTMGGGQAIVLSGAGVGGAGALINSAGDIYGNVLNVTLAGDAVIGGSGRWDFASGSTLSGAHKLSLMRASSGAYGEWNSLNIAPNVGDIELVTGKLGIKNMGSSFGNTASTLIVDDGFELDFWSGGCNRSIHVRSNGLVQILTALSAFDGNVTLDQGARWSAFWGSGNLPMNGTLTLNGVAHIVLGDANFVFTNVISGPGGFVWDAYNHQMVMTASNTYSGPTIIANGLSVALTGDGSISHSALLFFGGNSSSSVHLDASGRTDQTLTLASGQTLAGIGAVAGNLVVSAGATLSPAGTNTTLGITTGSNSTGTLWANSDITLAGTTVLKLNGAGTNDSVEAGGGITYGGTLNLVNIGSTALAVGDSFQVFIAASYSGNFAGVSPATPGPGLAWDLSQLNTGRIAVVAGASQPKISSSMLSGNQLILSGTGGLANSPYYVLSSTNVAKPVSAWTAIATNNFDSSGAFRFTNSVNPALRQQFFLLKVQ